MDSDDESRPFQYEALATEESLRLLRVDQGDIKTGVLSCTLFHIDRYHPPKGVSWTALSYRWGDEHDLIPMRLRSKVKKSSNMASTTGAEFLAPHSTVDMILQLYHSDRIAGKWIWVDYLCLNQRDLIEKGAQVGRIGTVFELSEETVAYMGPETSSTSMGVEIMKALSVLFKQLDEQHGDANTFTTTQEFVLEATGTSLDSPKWAALSELLSSPWFGRVWVIQEAVLPRSLVFVWGTYALTWHQLASLMRSDSSYVFNWLAPSVRNVTALATLDNIHQLRGNRAKRAKDSECGLQTAVILSNKATSSDPRDRIYGLLGLLYGPNSDISIDPNYEPSNTVANVFTDATRKWTLQTGSLDLLYYAGIGLLREIKELPSWVPDYTQRVRYTPEQHLRAGMGSYIQVDPEPLGFLGTDLVVLAFEADTVTRVMSYIEPESSRSYRTTNEFILNYGPTYLENAIRFVLQSNSAPWSERLLNCFVRTLTMNTGRDGASGLEEVPLPDIYDDVFAEMSVVQDLGIIKGSPMPKPEITALHCQSFVTSTLWYVENTICTLARNEMALVPQGTSPGDVIAVFPGARLPFVLRPSPEPRLGKKAFQLVGWCYVHKLDEGLHVAASYGDLQSIVIY
ncbi:heterokaryon incompatibility protein-domain-containing protein [Astrocystis sublimbata]|nr:heterokaryon incompatibility protein-domain-containing protein [Astrocystis sublimbata]